jgi:DNA-binding PadR family transcriptional regulator
MAISISTIAIGIVKSQIKKVVVNKAIKSVAKHQIKSKVSKKIIKGKYKVYSSRKNERQYTIKDLYRDSNSVKKLTKIANVKNATSAFRVSKSIINDVNNRIKREKVMKIVKNKLQSIQQEFKLNTFDKVVFDISQKSEGAFTMQSLKDSSKEYFNNIFEDKVVVENFTKAFQEYVDLRAESLERFGFLNIRGDSNVYEVTDIFHDRLNTLDMFNKEIVKELDFNKFHLFIINESIKNDGLSLNNMVELAMKNLNIDSPSQRYSMCKNICEKFVRYNYMDKSVEDNDIKYKMTEKGVSELYMYRDLDSIEKSIYSYLKEHNGIYDKDDYIKFIRQDKKLLNDLQKTVTLENTKEKKPFQFGKYDANHLFKEYFENGKLKLDDLIKKLDTKFSDPEEANKEYEMITKRLDKNCDHEYVSYDEETKTYVITDKGFTEAEIIAKAFLFSSYDVNVLFEYIDKGENGLDMPELKELLKEEYKQQSDLEKQYSYLQGRFDKNVDNGYMNKSDEGKYTISEKGREQQTIYFGELEQKIEDKLSFLKSAKMLNESLNENQLFQDVVDRRLNNFDKLIHEVSTLNKGVLNNESLMDNVTMHYIHNQGQTKAVDDKIKEFEEHIKQRVASLERVMFIKKNDDDTYSTTNKYNSAMLKQGELKEKLYLTGKIEELSKFHMYLLNQSITKEGLSVNELLEIYISDGLDNPQEKYNITVKTLDKLTVNKYLEYNTNGSYHITEKGVLELYKNKNLTAIERYIFDSEKDYNGALDINELTQKLMLDQKIIDKVKREIPKKDFAFGKYDANVIFKEFGEQNSLSLDILKTNMEQRFGDSDEAQKQYTITSKRIEKLKEFGFIDYDEATKLYKINSIGFASSKEINKQFIFTSYDVNVVFKYIDDNGGKLSSHELKAALENQYTEKDYANKQFEYLIRRFNKNVEAGYLDIDSTSNSYYLTTKGISERDQEFNICKNYLVNNIEILTNMGLINNENDSYYISNIFNNIVNSKIDKYDKILFDIAMNNDGIIDLNSLNSNLNIETDGDINNIFEYLNNRIDALVNVHYIRYFKDNSYEITDLFEEKIKEKFKISDKLDESTELKFTSFDKRIFNAANDNIISLVEREEYFKNRYKTNQTEADRQIKMITERCNKLEQAGYIQKIEDGYKIVKFPEIDNMKSAIISNKVEIDISKTIKITKFDLSNITDILEGNIWSIEAFKSKFTGIDSELLDKKIESVIKRLNSLERFELVKALGDNKWEVKEMLIERTRARANELTSEQIKVLDSLKDFMNCTEEQLTMFIYNGNDKIATSDLNSMVYKGYLEVESRDFGNGNYTKVYYLNTKGKKEICKLFDVKMENIYESKIHSRPEELYHDTLIYSAYNDVKDSLVSDNFTINKVMTDRQMRAFDMKNNHKQRKDYADLYVEFIDNETGDIGYLNVEIDVGYSPKVIAEKASSIDNLVWYTNSNNQANRITKYSNNTNVKVLQL